MTSRDPGSYQLQARASELYGRMYGSAYVHDEILQLEENMPAQFLPRSKPAREAKVGYFDGIEKLRRQGYREVVPALSAVHEQLRDAGYPVVIRKKRAFVLPENGEAYFRAFDTIMACKRANALPLFDRMNEALQASVADRFSVKGKNEDG